MPRRKSPFTRLVDTDDDDPIDADFSLDTSEALEKVEAYVESVLTDPDSEGSGDRVTFVLKPVSIGSKGAPLQTFTVGYDEDPGNVAGQIVDAASAHGEIIRGKCRYAVNVAGKDGFGVRGFTIEFSDREDSDVLEAPEMKGALAIMMRHSNENQRGLLTVVKDSLQTARQREHEAMERVKAHEQTSLDTLRMMGDIYRAQQERDLAVKKLEREEARKDQIGGMLMNAVPHLVNKLAGGRILKEPQTPVEMQLEGLFRTLDLEQYQALEKILKPDQVVALSDMLQVIQKKVAARKAAEAAGAAGASEETKAEETPAAE